MSRAVVFDNLFYLESNADVASAVRSGDFESALNHFILFGDLELRAPNSIFDPVYYSLANPIVVDAINRGDFNGAFQHYQLFGEVENRAPSLEFFGFNPETYLSENLDVSEAVRLGIFSSALDHYISFGQQEERIGTGIIEPSFELTAQTDYLKGTTGDDIFFGRAENFTILDRINGGSGLDTLEIIHTGLAIVPNLSNATNIERLKITDTEHQSLNFSELSEINSIVLNGGTTVNGNVITTTIGDHQSLSLQNLINAGFASASVTSGGMIIDQPATASTLDLKINKVGEKTNATEKYFVIDIMGEEITHLNIENENSSSLIFFNSGGSLTDINLTGDGSINLDTLPSGVTILEAANAIADIELKTAGSETLVSTGSGDDKVRLGNGVDHVTTRDGKDTIIAGGGANVISAGPGNDKIFILSGINSVFASSGDDGVTLQGGTNDVKGGGGSDAVSISGGDNVVDTGPGDDTFSIIGGDNSVISGKGNDIIIASAGINIVNSGTGNDQITLSGGTNEIDAGEGDDVVNASGGASNVDIRVLKGGLGSDTLSIVSTGNVTLPTSTGFENIFISDTVHQSLDVSLSSSVEQIELDSGTTIDGDVITITLADGQTLLLNSILDGDTSAASVNDGGIRISQDASITSLELALDDVGPSSSVANENVFIDIAGTGVSAATVTSGNDSFVVISNSGGALISLQLLGTGTMALGTLPTSITNVNGTGASANLTLTIGSGNNTIRGGSGNDAITLTGGVNDVQTGDGDDTITTSTNLVSGDRIDGGDGSDTFEVIHTGLATIPSTANLISIENITIQDTVHQSLDFSTLTSITGIELDSGTTVNGATINTTLGADQSLTLDSITDGDTAAASLADGGIKVIQPNSSTSLDLTLDDIGPAAASTNENIFIDIAGANVANLNITSANDSFVVLENSGASISTINIEGSGTLSLIGALPNSITTINGGTSSTSLTVSTGTAGGTITGGSGNDVIVLGGGTNNVNSGNGNDTVTLSTGNDTVSTGSGSDTVTASSGTNNITTGANDDQITLSGGSNTVNSGASNDQFTISGGTNNIDTESGNDQVTISGGNNTIATGNNNDTISASNGVNNINTGSGDNQITLTGGTNTVVTGDNDDTVNASGGNNDIDTAAGDDNVVLTGGTNDVNTGSNSDTVTLSSGTDTVDMGSENDTVLAGANLSTADTVNGGAGTSDIIEITTALTDALTARLSNFEVLEIKGGGGITHDITGLAGLTSLKASGALTGAVVITDLAEAAEVDISAAIGNDLTINQINSAGGSDTLTIDLRGGSYTTGGAVVAPNIETVTIQTNQNGNITLSGGTFADATNITIAASRANLTITDLTAINMTALDVSSSSREVNITTGADVFSGAFTFSSGSRDDTLDLDGATLVAGSVFELGGRQDTLTLNADAVATVVRTSVTGSNNAFSVRDDATTTNTPGFTSGSDTFDYNGSLSHDSVTSVVAASGATLQAAVAADADATVYVIQDANGDADLERELNVFADGVTRTRANTLETEAADTGLLSYTGLDSAFGSTDIVLIAIDSETNEDATTANDGGTAVYRFQNSNTSTVDTVLSSELELIGIFQDAALGTGDFV